MSGPVVAISELYAPNIGGQESRFARFARALAARGRDVTVYTTDHTGGQLPREEIDEGVTIRRHVAIPGYLKNGGRSIPGLLRYRRAVRELVAGLPRSGSAIWVNQMPVVHLGPIAADPRVVVDWCEYPTDWRVNYLSRRAVRRSRWATSVSLAVASHLGAISPSTRFDVVRTPVAPAAGAPATREPGTILFVGRLVAHKNLGSLASAVKALAGNGGPHTRLLIAGDGPERASMERRYGGNGAVRFLGVIDEAEKQRLLRTAWMVAVPGRREGLPNIAVEATAHGTPLLAAGAPANSCGDFIRRHDVGIVAPGSDAAAFRAALHSVDATRWERWSKEALETSRLFDPAPNVDRLDAVLARAAG